QLTKSLNRIVRLHWQGDDVRLYAIYKVEPLTFKLREYFVVGNEKGVRMQKYPLNEQYRSILASLNQEPIGYKELIRRFKQIEERDISSQIVVRLMEAGLLRGYDKNGAPVSIQRRLRFDGVGAEYEV
ncbi:MAG: alkylhalidase, partial [Sulfurifustaceae bacterium]